MTAPQHRAQLADRVQRLEATAFRLGAELGDLKTAIEQLPITIRQEFVEYTEPVFGEIMAGKASPATKENLDQLEHRLKDLIETQFAQIDAKVDRLLAALSQPPSS
ncbi:hypothetical protein [Nonomuraea bangladeshensis]|uniref:hypothetical protein n=1 Tax=Nonomuraea bangladeshensis TaxID=404385 RepID=UPI0031DC12C9